MLKEITLDIDLISEELYQMLMQEISKQAEGYVSEIQIKVLLESVADES